MRRKKKNPSGPGRKGEQGHTEKSRVTSAEKKKGPESERRRGLGRRLAGPEAVRGEGAGGVWREGRGTAEIPGQTGDRLAWPEQSLLLSSI